MVLEKNTIKIKLRKDFYCYLFLERGEGREKGRETSVCERNIDLLPLSMCPNRGRGPNPGMCPHQESNLRPFALWEDAQSTEPCPSGQNSIS